MDQISAGEAGGVFAGCVALLATLGGGFRWLVGWGDRRIDLREKKLTSWEASLLDREKAYRETIEGQLRTLRGEVETFRGELASTRGELTLTRGVLLEVTIELRGHVPRSEALDRAAAILRKAFPLEETPPDLIRTAKRMNTEPPAPA